MGVKVTKDESEIQRFLMVTGQLSQKTLKIGLFSSSGGEVLMIGYVNEFGFQIQVTEKMRNYLAATGLRLKNSTTQINIPERAFIRGAYDKNQKKIAKYAESQLDLLFTFKISVDEFYERVGEYCVGRVRKYMTDLKAPANHPYTVDRKKSSNPLIDTGTMREKITYKVT